MHFLTVGICTSFHLLSYLAIQNVSSQSVAHSPSLRLSAIARACLGRMLYACCNSGDL